MVFVLVVAAQVYAQSSVENYALGMEHWQNGKYAEAFELFKRAADAGHVDGCLTYAKAYLLGQGVDINEELAYEYFEKAAKLGSAEGEYFLGAICISNRGDVKEGMKWYKKASKNGYAHANYQMALLYVTDEYGMANVKTAVKWLKKGVKGGDDTSMDLLGTLYAQGVGVGKSLRKAVELFEMAGEKGNRSSQYNLGVCYSNGMGVEKDDYKAYEWYKMAADNGSTYGQYQVALCYEDGRGVKTDSLAAVLYFKQAAEKGHEESTWKYAKYLYYGLGGGNVNYEAAVGYILKAANKHVIEAQDLLAECYEKGRGVPVNEEKAKKWRENAESSRAAKSLQEMLGGKFRLETKDLEEEL